MFNAVFFDGKQVLKPEDLTEADTDVSSLLKFNGHAETVKNIMKEFGLSEKEANGYMEKYW